MLNFEKCKCLYTGYVNRKMGDIRYYSKRKGVTISIDVKVSEQCGIAASKGNQISNSWVD